jgi:hypothetical protein
LSFHFESIEAGPDVIGTGRERNYPIFFCEKLGPQGTIAKAKVERKEKSQKRPEKCGFFGGMWKSPLKMRLEAALRTCAMAQIGSHGTRIACKTRGH